MAESTVHVIAHIPARAETAETVRATLLGLLGPTRREDGCLRYDLMLNSDALGI